VLEAAAARAGWDRRRRGNATGWGIAGGFEKGSYVATVAEVSVDAKRVPRIERLVVAYECGAIVNPDGLRNQVEGAVIQGIGGALFERIEFENGRIRNGRFEQYRVPRFTDVPPIELVLLDRKDLPPAGAGETPIVAVAPAIGNAIFAAAGVRLRSMPLLPNGRLEEKGVRHHLRACPEMVPDPFFALTVPWRMPTM
jgi:isoquinoline 1-oxidoreductase